MNLDCVTHHDCNDTNIKLFVALKGFLFTDFPPKISFQTNVHNWTQLFVGLTRCDNLKKMQNNN